MENRCGSGFYECEMKARRFGAKCTDVGILFIYRDLVYSIFWYLVTE